MRWWRVECDAEPDLDVPAGDADVFDEEATTRSSGWSAPTIDLRKLTS